MADFRPFPGWRYSPEKCEISSVIAPPYDIISQQEQIALYQKSPYNCVRLILNKPEEGDSEGCNVYTRARDFFRAWSDQGVICQDDRPCFYLYRQLFKDPETGRDHRRLALLGVIRLEPFDKGIVVPHERTLKKPCEDRRRLLEATATNFSPVFGLYEDPAEDLARLTADFFSEGPLYSAKDGQNVLHEIRLVSDGPSIEKIQRFFSGKKIYIADGHHRYQTALGYAEKMRAFQKNSSRDLPSDFALMALVEFNDPGLLIYPTHRMLRKRHAFLSSSDIEAYLEKLQEVFDIEPVEFETLEAESRQASQERAVGLVFRGKAYRLTIRDFPAAKKRMPEKKAEIWYELDTSWVSYLVLADLWKIPETEWESLLAYTHSSREVFDRVYNGSDFEVGFMLKPPRPILLKKMGEAGELMPQKSTYFYPKLASGLVFYSHGLSAKS